MQPGSQQIMALVRRIKELDRSELADLSKRCGDRVCAFFHYHKCVIVERKDPVGHETSS